MRKKIVGVTVGTPISPEALKKKLDIDSDSGGVQFETDETLTLKDGILSVNTTTIVEKVLEELPVYDGTVSVTPAVEEQTLYTAKKMLDADIKIEKIPYAEVSNNSGGVTATIGGI